MSEGYNDSVGITALGRRAVEVLREPTLDTLDAFQKEARLAERQRIVAFLRSYPENPMGLTRHLADQIERAPIDE